MCTTLLSIYFVLEWLGLPSEAGIGIGTYVSYIGTHRFSRWVSKKIGMEDKEYKGGKGRMNIKSFLIMSEIN